MAADLPRENNTKSRGRRKEVFATAEQPEGVPGVLKPNSLIAERTRALPHRHGNSPPPPRRLPTLEAVKLFPRIDAATPPEYNSQQVLSMPRHYQLFPGYNWKIFPRLVSPVLRSTGTNRLQQFAFIQKRSLSRLFTCLTRLISLLPHVPFEPSGRPDRSPCKMLTANQPKVFLPPTSGLDKTGWKKPYFAAWGKRPLFLQVAPLKFLTFLFVSSSHPAKRPQSSGLAVQMFFLPDEQTEPLRVQTPIYTDLRHALDPITFPFPPPHLQPLLDSTPRPN